MPRSVCLILITAIIFAGCSGFTSTESILENIDDSDILPYSFVQDGIIQRHWLTTSFPIDINGDGIVEFCEIQNNWRDDDTLTAIIIQDQFKDGKILFNKNIKTSRVQSFLTEDIDGNQSQELLVTYVTKDSLYFRMYEPDIGISYERYLVSGIDINNSGHWDGEGTIIKAADINNDKYKEIFISCNSGYDLSPRSLICLDIKNDKILWTYYVAGPIHSIADNFHLFETREGCSIIFGIGSTDNGVVKNGMSDGNSYLVCLNESGKLNWNKQMGGSSSSTVPIVFQYGGIHQGVIASQRTYYSENKEKEGSRIIIMDIEGNILDSIDYGYSKKAHRTYSQDFDGDGLNELAVTIDDNSFIIYDNDLNPAKIIRHENNIYLKDHRDFLGTDEKQFLITTDNNDLWLLDKEFDVIAINDYTGDLYPYKNPGDAKIRLVLSTNYENRDLFLKKNSWSMIFARNPVLAGIVVFAPMSIIVALIAAFLWKTKRQNKTISRQRDTLDNTLSELKETQMKLIAAEKYKQAKDIAGGVSHEVYNALSPAIYSLDKVLQSKGGTGAITSSEKDLLNISKESVERAIKTTEMVTQYSRLESEKIDQMTNLKDVIDSVIKINKARIEEVDVKLSVDINSNIQINCLNAHAFSLFNNLMINAIDALENKDNPEIKIAARQNDQISIIFEDNGRGIPEKNIERVFDLFYSTKPNKGTGIGLSMVKRIVELYDGEIILSSTMDKGTYFTILWKINK